MRIRLRWIGHVLPGVEEHVGQRAKRMVMGPRKKEKPMGTWRACFKDDLEEVAVSIMDVNNQKRWEGLICTGNPSNGNFCLCHYSHSSLPMHIRLQAA